MRIKGSNRLTIEDERLRTPGDVAKRTKVHPNINYFVHDETFKATGLYQIIWALEEDDACAEYS